MLNPSNVLLVSCDCDLFVNEGVGSVGVVEAAVATTLRICEDKDSVLVHPQRTDATRANICPLAQTPAVGAQRLVTSPHSLLKATTASTVANSHIVTRFLLRYVE